MDIRTKFVLGLVAVALGSMIALGAFMYSHTTRQLERHRLEQLDGLAESMKEGLVQIESGWEDRVRLIASRTQLREILRVNDLAGSPEAKARIRQILADAYAAGSTVESLAVYDALGRFVGSAGWGTESDLTEELLTLLDPGAGVVYQRVWSPEDEELRVAYAAALTSDGTGSGELVGVLQVRLDAKPLVALTRNRAGLGVTGETLIAIRDAEGGVRVLKRDGPGTPPRWGAVELHGPTDPVSIAMEGRDGAFSEGLVDSSGKPVWAAVRHIPETDWGLVVKIDASEGREPSKAYWDNLTDVIISLAALAILLGTMMGLRFAKPIQELANAAHRIKEGDLSVRAPATSQDEMGLLARNFNQMAEELEQQVTLLREFRNYFDLSRDMLCIAETDGYFKRVNPAFERILGWTAEELLSRRFLDFVHPDDLKKTEDEIASLAQGLPTIAFENLYMCKDGSEKRLAWTAHPQPDTGLIYAIARDVTDLRREREEASNQIEYLKDRLEKAEAKPRGDP
ncbi:MAG: PAS domain S-box protein [Gemmatimonadota bacterium]